MFPLPTMLRLSTKAVAALGVTSRTARHRSVVLIQDAVAQPASAGFASLVAAVDEVVQLALWREARSDTGAAFGSFGTFAVAPPPYGLGVRTRPAARLIRHALLENKHFGSWTELLELTGRQPGRPKKGTNDEGLRFYTVSRAATSRDRLLLQLKQHCPDTHYVSVCNGECSPYRAGVNAGLVAQREKPLVFGVCDVERAKRLSKKKKGRLLCLLFRQLGVDAQCELLANEIDGHFDVALAKRWRQRFLPSGAPLSGTTATPGTVDDPAP